MLNEMVQQAVDELLQAAPGSKVFLVGPWLRGEPPPDGDMDLLVVEPDVPNCQAEMVRLSRILGERLIPSDVVVFSQETFDHWKETPNTLSWRAATEGRLYERGA